MELQQRLKGSKQSVTNRKQSNSNMVTPVPKFAKPCKTENDAERKEQKCPSEPPPSYDETIFRDEVDGRFNETWNSADQHQQQQPPQQRHQQPQYIYRSGHGGSTGFPGSGSQTYSNSGNNRR